ncbi:MAG TPA: hypothetical protein VGP97_02715 [Burkholderiales bacterium]|jgi:hypothetical protein|nr:hypothetical protein [Burkholderiales bacterium]
MSSPDKKPAAAQAYTDPNLELAREIFIGMAQRIYSAPSSPEQKKPDPKALATLCFRLAEAFEAASHETPKVKAALEAASKAAVKLDEVDMSHVFKPTEEKS